MRPLSGITVLDCTQIYNGPYAAFLMAQAGAEVIKIEPPGGEHLRKRTAGGMGLPFAMLNANKRSLKLDLKTEAGRDILKQLASKADVLVENFAPGVMDRLGLGAAAMKAVNPRLIYACSSGYGSTGPYRDYPAMDLTVQAMAGYMSITGFEDKPPVKAGPAVCDFLAGVHLYGAIVTALLERERGGEVRSVEVSMLEASYFPLGSGLSLLATAKQGAPLRVGNRHSGLSLCPYNVYPTSDGHIAIITSNEAQWVNLLRAFGREAEKDDPRWRTVHDRVRHMELVDGMVAGWTSALDKQALFEKLLAARVPCAPVRTLEEVMHDPHLHARGALQWIEHPEYGRLAVPTSPLRFSGLDAPDYRPSETLGQESRAVLAERLGLDDAALDALAAQGVI